MNRRMLAFWFGCVLAAVASLAATWRPEMACARTHYAVVETLKVDALAERLNYVEEQCGEVIAVEAQIVNGTTFVLLVYRLPMQE